MADLDLVRLPNGVRIALDPMPGLGTAALGVWQRVGARWEPAEINGIAHLFEHMAFKGAGPRDARQFAEAIENVGGVYSTRISASGIGSVFVTDNVVHNVGGAANTDVDGARADFGAFGAEAIRLGVDPRFDRVLGQMEGGVVGPHAAFDAAGRERFRETRQGRSTSNCRDEFDPEPRTPNPESRTPNPKPPRSTRPSTLRRSAIDS